MYEHIKVSKLLTQVFSIASKMNWPDLNLTLIDRLKGTRKMVEEHLVLLTEQIIKCFIEEGAGNRYCSSNIGYQYSTGVTD